MIVGAHQPHYLPWVRLIDKIARSDVFILLDDVQFTKNGFQNRVKIKHAQGTMYLTVPVLDPFGKLIREVRINTEFRWRAKHQSALITNYGKAPYFAEYRDLVMSIYDRPWESLVECNVYALEVVLGALGVRTRLMRSSELGVPGKGTERLVGLCQAVGATVYLSGDFAVGHHFDPAEFAPHGIEVRPQGWQCPTYRQQYPQLGFLPDLSVVDLLFNEGKRALAVLLERSSEAPGPLSAGGEAAPGGVLAGGPAGQRLAPPAGVDRSNAPFSGAYRPDEVPDSSLCRTPAPPGGAYTERVPQGGPDRRV